MFQKKKKKKMRKILNNISTKQKCFKKQKNVKIHVFDYFSRLILPINI
jgi:hypothetical protein